MLDTGAAHSIADADLGYIAGGHHPQEGVDDTMRGAGWRNVTAYYTTDLRLRLDGFDDSARVDHAMDLRSFKTSGAKGAPSVGAMLGDDFLSRYIVEIDHPASWVRFYEPP